MLPEKLLEVLSHEGCVTILSWGVTEEPNLACTWNSYINLTEDGRMLIPAAGMKGLQANVEQNNRIKITLASKQVMGNFSMGTGFEIEGEATFFNEGEAFEKMHQKYPFMKRLLSVKVNNAKQLL